VVPLTRLALKSNAVRHQVAAASAIDDDASLTNAEEIQKLKELDAMNCYYCQILATNGF
jgi:hypothetical protein